MTKRHMHTVVLILFDLKSYISNGKFNDNSKANILEFRNNKKLFLPLGMLMALDGEDEVFRESTPEPSPVTLEP